MLELEYPSSPSLRYQHFWFLDLRLRLNYITTFLVLQFADGRQWDFLASIIVWANSYWYNKSLLPYMYPIGFVSLSSVQSLSHVQLFATPWTTAHQASLSITNSRSPPKSTSLELVMPSNHLILCHPLLLLPSIFPSITVFQMSQLFASGGQSIGVSASISVLPMNTQDWSPLGWTGWISLQSKELSRVFSNSTVQKHQFFGAQLSL